MRGPETQRSHAFRQASGFYDEFMKGNGLDIGYKGSLEEALPVLPTATGVDVDYPGYDGKCLPFSDESQEYVFSSHTLEHISDTTQAIREWFRVLKTNGYLIIIVPHYMLYEKKAYLPSNWNADHKYFYSPALLMQQIEASLTPNTYRLRRLIDNDRGYDYSIPPDRHSNGCYEIECVIQKITPPHWTIK